MATIPPRSLASTALSFSLVFFAGCGSGAGGSDLDAGPDTGPPALDGSFSDGSTSVRCERDEHGQSGACVMCPAGTFREAGDVPSEGDTSCDPVLCVADQRVAAHACVDCGPGTVNAEGDDASGGDTRCDATLCAADEHVADHACVACDPGNTNMAGDDASGGDTRCDGQMCASNEFVQGHACAPCPVGTANMAGDDPSGPDTVCDPTLCAADEHVTSHTCTPCAPGTTNSAGDDASGDDTVCDPILCATDEHVISHSCFSCDPGTTNPAGDNASGPDTLCDRAVHSATQVDGGESHTCALLDDGSVKCWGGNSNGQLGQEDVTYRGTSPGQMGNSLLPIDLGTGRTATAIATGRSHTCALLDDGTVKCWGSNLSGQLGQEETRARRGTRAGEMGDSMPPVDLGTGRTATAIAAGAGHTCALLDDGTVKCWGENNEGQLGQGDRRDRGRLPGEMGDSLPPISLGAGRTATAITAGRFHTCALLDDGTVKCWGFNNDGQLGQEDRNNRGDRLGQMGNNLLPIDLGTGRTAITVTAGTFHTCALLDDGTMKCWGDNRDGQLGQGDRDNRGDSRRQMGDRLPPIDLGAGRTATAITAGRRHSCALLDDGTAKCWGYNFSGQLGLGDGNTRGDDAGEMGDSLSPVELGAARTATAIAAGSEADHTCSLLDDGSMRCWGYNSSGQLGLGDRDARGDGPGEMGDRLRPIDLGTP